MQKGFATLEIIFATMIIAILMGAAIPNAARVIDRVALDYETKKLYSKLRDVQAFDRMTNMKDSHFSTNDESSVISLEILSDKKTYLVRNRTSSSHKEPYEIHTLPKGFTFYDDGTENFSYIKFDDMGKPRGMNNYQNPKGKALNGHIRINSSFNKDSYIYFDSVGRFRGGRE